MIRFFNPNFGRDEWFGLLAQGVTRETFEARLATVTGASQSVSFAYARAGILAILEALNIRGAEVILPAFTSASVIEPVIASGNIPVFVDVLPDDLTMDLDALLQAITPQTRAVIAVHMYGYRINIRRLREITGNARLLLIEDASHSMLPYSDEPELDRGDMTIYSFGPGKQIYTLRGGAVTSLDEQILERIKVYRGKRMNDFPTYLYSRRAIQMLNATFSNMGSLGTLVNSLRDTETADKAGRKIWNEVLHLPPDVRSTFSPIQARIGVVQLGKLETILTSKRQIASYYHHAFQQLPGVTPSPLRPQASYTYAFIRLFSLSNKMFKKRMRARGVDVLEAESLDLPGYDKYKQYRRGLYPQTTRAGQQIVYLPIHSGLSAADVVHIADSVQEIIGS